MPSKISLSFLMCVLSFILAQELAFFEKDSTVDFEKDNILADMQPLGEKHITPNYHPTGKDVRTSSVVNHISDSDTTTPKLAKIIVRSQTRSTYKEEKAEDEVTARFAPILAAGETTMTESIASAADKEISTAASTTAVGRRSDLQDLYGDLLVQMPPNIRWPLSQQRIVVLEQHQKGFSVTCQAEGQPVPTYQWWKDDQLLDNKGSFITAFDNGTLFFTDFKSRENGLYQCFATNSLGTSVSVKVPIVSERPPGITRNVSLVKTAKEGQPLFFECADTPQTIPEYFKRWYLLAGTTQLPITNRIGTDSKGVLRFAYLEPEDAATYICALTPEVAEAGGSIRFYNMATLTVESSTKIPSSPKLAYASKLVNGTLGKSATLECFFSGYPIAEITWKNSSNHVIKKGDKKFIIDESSFGRRLIVTDLQEENAGNFTCSGNNGYGTVTETITLNVTAPPQGIPFWGLGTLTVPDGGDTVLKCKAKAVNRQHLDIPVWYRNGQPFNESNLPFQTRYSLRSDRTELHISGLNKELDTACFQCNISNSEGYLFYDGYLRVINSIQIQQRPPENNVITKDSKIDISIKAKGDECCKIDKRWQRDNTPLTRQELEQPPFIWNENADTLMFDASSVDELTLSSKVGKYTCRVSDEYQSVDVHFSISWNMKIDAAGFELWWIGLVCGILLILVAIVIIIIFIKSNYPRDTYPLEKAEIKHHLNPEKDLLDQSFQEI